MNWLWRGSGDVVFKTDSEHRRDKLKRSILLFLGTGIVVVLIAAFFLMLSYDFDMTNVIGSETGDLIGNANEYVVKKVSGEENIFMYCTDDDEKNVTFMCAVKFDMDKKEIKVLPLSVTEKNYRYNAKRTTASACYRGAGVLQLLNSVEEYTGIDFDKYVGCKEGSVEGIIANFSPLSIDFNKNMSFVRDGDTVIFEEGVHEIPDDAVVKLLTYSSSVNNVDEFRGKILLQMFKQYFNETTLENRNIIYSNIISQTDSDVSVVDVAEYKDYIVVLSSDSVKKKYTVSEDIEDFR